MSDVCKIENHTAALIVLFPTESFPNGVKLIPGLNSVPALFLEEFRAHSVMTEAANGRPSKQRFPGVEVLADLEVPVTINTANGRHRGPRITIYTDDQFGRSDGPMAPTDLKSYSLEAALALIKMTTDKAVLKRWAKDTRRDVAQACSAKLVG